MNYLKTRFQNRLVQWALLLALALSLATPSKGWACAACMGNPDEALTQGLNWGIASLLGVVLTVLGGAAAFFVTIARRAARWQQQNLSEGKPAGAALPQTAGTIQ